MLASLPLLLVLSGFFSGSETCFFSLSSHQRLRLSRAGTVVTGCVVRLLDEKRLLLVTLLLGNMVVNVGFFVVTTVLLLALREQSGAPGWVMAVLNISPLLCLILFGEVLPKLIASSHAMPWARASAVPLLLMHRLLSPVRIVSTVLVIQPLARLIAPSRHPPALSPEELRALLDLSQQRGVINVEEEHLLQQVLSLGQMKVRNLMTPRVDMVAFDLDREPAELMQIVREHPLSRIPVYRDDLDHVEGVVYRRQVLLHRPADAPAIAALVRRVDFVPELQRADQLLVDLRRRGMTQAIVVDEYGGTAGLVTLEDVVEHMVGQIEGPHKGVAEPQAQRLDARTWRVDADLSVRAWRDAFGQGGAAPGVGTVGGLIMSRLGRVPAPGDRTELGNVVIEVETMAGRRPASLLIRLRPDRADAAMPLGGGGA